MSGDADPAPLLQVSGLSKSFGGAHALVDVDLHLRLGEIHGLLGQNGSGKSTLLKVLSGFHASDSGRLALRGAPVDLPLAPGAFRALGMAFVHQDLGLVPALSVCENLIVSRLGGGWRPLRWGEERRRAGEALARHHLDGIDPAAPVGSLTQMQRALLAIVRAVEELGADEHAQPLLILDEPTAFLPRVGIERLFGLLRALVDDGASVLFVTHDLDEVLEICDRVTVLRDGRLSGSVNVASATTGDLVELIIGRRLEQREMRSHAPVDAGEVRLRAMGVGGQVLNGVGFDLHRGEVLGITGLVGSGFEELPHLLFGARSGRGTIELAGETLELSRLSPERAIAVGMGLVPSDRPLDGVIGTLSVTDNVTMTTMDEQQGRLGLSRARMRTSALRLGERFAVAPNRPELPLAALSGGNQQKVVLAKWLQREPRVLLLDQPTQGVDVGARQQIFDAVRAAAAHGTSVVCASADYEEIAALCDRLLIVARGRVVQRLEGEDLTKDRIAEQVLTSTTVPDVFTAEVA